VGNSTFMGYRQIWKYRRKPTQFYDFQPYFCPHITESANVAESAQYRRNFAKNFGDIGLPPVTNFLGYRSFNFDDESSFGPKKKSQNGGNDGRCSKSVFSSRKTNKKRCRPLG
jgi:hypothetical protein